MLATSFALDSVLGWIIADPSKPPVFHDELDVNFAQGDQPGLLGKSQECFRLQARFRLVLESGADEDLCGRTAVTFKGPAVRVVTRPVRSVLGTLRVKVIGRRQRVPGRGHQHFWPWPCVYLAAGFDAAYYLYAYPYQRLMLATRSTGSRRSPAPMKVEAPMCVHSTLMRQPQEDGERLIVHLFNDLNTTAHHALPNDDVPFGEEVVPIHDIQVTFGPDYRLDRIHLEPGGQNLKVVSTAGGSSVVVPRLDIHTMVVAEFALQAQ